MEPTTQYDFGPFAPDADTLSRKKLRLNFVSIMTKGKKDNTYKFALARYLLHHASKENAGLTIRYKDI